MTRLDSGRFIRGFLYLLLTSAPARVMLSATANVPATAGPAGEQSGPSPVAPILERLDRIASLYREQALQFTCDERMTFVDTKNRTEFRDFEYIYVSDDAGRLLDYRTLPHARVRKGQPPPEVDPKQYDFPVYMRRAYSWIFIFEHAKRGRYAYTLDGEEVLKDRRCLRLRFEPIPPVESDVNDWYGTAWIDAETFQILHVEALKEMQHTRKVAFDRVRTGADPHALGKPIYFSDVVTDFEAQKNTLTLPASVVITSKRCVASQRALDIHSSCSTEWSLTQTYSRYRFFGVRTSEEIQQLLGGRPAPPP